MDTRIRSQPRCRYNWTTRNLHLSSCPSSLPFATSRSRHPDNPFGLSLYPTASIRSPSLALAPCFSSASLPSTSPPLRPSLYLDRDSPTCSLLLLLRLHAYLRRMSLLRYACLPAYLYIFRYFLHRLFRHRPCVMMRDVRDNSVSLRFFFALCYFHLSTVSDITRKMVKGNTRDPFPAAKSKL